ncbi:MAG: hypothetical protein RIQ54_238 [Candidatus Parcubacteria bacterium]|jgi:uncharacterized membrane protein
MTSLWIFFALFSGVADSFKPLFGKKSLGDMSFVVVGWAQWFFGLFVLLPIFFWRVQVPAPYFWWVLVLNGVLNVCATILYWHVIKTTDISRVLPVVLSATPIFLLVTSPLMLGEIPNKFGLLGVLVAAIGIYMVNFEKRSRGLWAPLIDIFVDDGLRSSLLIAVIWSVTSNLDQVLVQASSPVFYITLMHALMVFFLIPFFVRQGINTQLFCKNFWILAATGFASAFALLFQMIALSGGIVPYVLALKRTSVLFGIIWGAVFFKEQHFKQRFWGGLIVLAGVVLISILG